jgi:hypothetical protein
VIGVTEGYVKFRRQMNNIRQQQPNAIETAAPLVTGSGPSEHPAA